MKTLIAMIALLTMLTGCGCSNTEANPTTPDDSTNGTVGDTTNDTNTDGTKDDADLGDAIDNGMDNAGDAIDEGMQDVGDAVTGKDEAPNTGANNATTPTEGGTVVP